MIPGCSSSQADWLGCISHCPHRRRHQVPLCLPHCLGRRRRQCHFVDDVRLTHPLFSLSSCRQGLNEHETMMYQKGHSACSSTQTGKPGWIPYWRMPECRRPQKRTGLGRKSGQIADNKVAHPCGRPSLPATPPSRPVSSAPTRCRSVSKSSLVPLCVSVPILQSIDTSGPMNGDRLRLRKGGWGNERR